MTVSIDFFGAAGTVTGSCYRVTHPKGNFLVDCGMFQGSKTLSALNYRALPFNPAEAKFLLLTHAHIDHSGMIPRLSKLGFRSPIYATQSTSDLLTFMLPDSANIQESEVARINRRNSQRGQQEVTPIYTLADAEAALRLIREAPYEQWLACGPGVRARYWNAGHILGSASIEIDIETGDANKPGLRLLFSGDLGPSHKAFHPDPEAPASFDFVVTESTYGGRDRPDLTPPRRRAVLRDEVLAAFKRGGNLLIPSFAIERSQELMLDLGHLIRTKELPRATVYVDSPLAVKATQVFMAHAKDLEDLDDGSPFEMPNFHFVQTVEQSKAINRVTSGAIILSASGMCDAGRIRHHLKQNLWRPEATVLFVGYQAPGTLGRLLLSGARTVRIHGEEVSVRAAIRRLEAYSGHADGPELVEWIRERLPVRHGIFLTHGEEETRAAFKQALVAAGCDGGKIFTPQLDDRFDLLQGSLAAAAERRLPPEAIASGFDWHNAYAALSLDLRQKLNALDDDKSRNAMLERLRVVVADQARPESNRGG
ncbi:MAG: MBL fold metallo-hydrolase RNA specificity domain-containing protein [Dongiaceae bacterium]